MGSLGLKEPLEFCRGRDQGLELKIWMCKEAEGFEEGLMCCPAPNSSSYFLQELQLCLKDPDWLAQLFIKHVRLGPSRERACDGSGLSGAVASFVTTYSAFFHVIPVRSAGCICMWSTVRISPSQNMWCQNLGTATLRSVGEASEGGGDKNIESA